jgi:hypothetical protein
MVARLGSCVREGAAGATKTSSSEDARSRLESNDRLTGSVTRPSNSAASGPLAGLDYAVVAFAALCLFGYAAAHRMVDDDEGFYALAGRSVLTGRVPYRDFFFPQTPLSAFGYASFEALGARGLLPLRWCAASCAVGTTLLVQHGARREAGRVAGLLSAALFMAHTLSWEWAVTVKTFPLGLLFGMVTLLFATSRVVSPRAAFVAGVFSGLTILARGLSVPYAVAALGALALREGESPHRLLLRRVLLGLGIGLLPALWLGLLDPAAFWFDNIGYHALRSPGEGLIKDAAQKFDAARAVFLAPFGARRPDVTGLQSTALVVAAVAAWRGAASPGARYDDVTVRPFAAAALLVVITSFLPSPVYVQYFVAAVPAASVAAAVALVRTGWSRWKLGALLAAYAAVAVPSFRDRLVDVPDLDRPAASDQVGRVLDRVTREGEKVAAHWPGYLVSSRRASLDEALNQFARLSSDRVSASARERYHLFTEEDFRAALVRGDAGAFVVGAFTVPETALALKASGWTFAAGLRGVTVWVPPRAPPE